MHKLLTMKNNPFALVMMLAVLLVSSSAMAHVGGPYMTINGKRSGSISKADLFKPNVLEACGRTIVNYTFIIVVDNKTIVQKQGEGHSLNDEIKQMIKSAEAGQRIYFENITVEMKGGKQLKLPPAKFVLE